MDRRAAIAEVFKDDRPVLRPVARGRHVTPRVIMLTDALAIAAAVFVSALAAEWINLAIFDRGFITSEVNWLMRRLPQVGVFALLLLAWLAHRGHYRNRLPFWTEAKHVFLGVVAFGLVDAYTQFAMKEQFSRLWLSLGWILTGLFIIGSRLAVKHGLRAAGPWRLPTLIAGDGPNAADVRQALESESYLGYEVIGAMPLKEFAGRNVKSAGDLGGADFVIVAPEDGQHHESEAILRSLQLHHIPFSLAPSIRGFSVYNMEAQHFYSHDVMLLAARNNLARPMAVLLKRTFDILVSIALLAILSPFLLLIAAWVKLSSPGPVFFKQTRIGRRGREFVCLKFRTMRADAEDVLAKLIARDPEMARQWGELQKLADDPRVTSAGKFLRKTSLDELPQLFNVLKGEMSLVGPRPIVPGELARYGDDAEIYLMVRPGMTGLWQVSGRNATTYDARVWLDSWYVRNWSLWQDIAILFRTIPVILKRSGV